ncbi:hypothetical protein D3Z52_23945, partial [Clostridiaceae bacterium]|nr:hypothetical protein [Clostridiaceae bacterium]
MEDVYIALQQAADLEGLKYRGMLARVQRTPEQYQIKRNSREIGGKAEIMVAVSSLSPKARRAWRA